MGFSSLQHIKDRRSTQCGFCLPATFRLQGLVTLLTIYSLRARAGFVSHRQRSWDSPFGAFPTRQVSGTFPPGRTHIPFHPPVLPRRSVRPAQQAAVPGLQPCRESLVADTVLVCRQLAAPLGFTLLGPSSENLVRDFARAPPSHFTTGTLRPHLPVPRSLDQLSPGSCRTRQAENRTNNPCRVLAPERSRAFKRAAVRAMSSPRTAPCIAADIQCSLDGQPRSTGVARETSEVPSITRPQRRTVNIARVSDPVKLRGVREWLLTPD